MSDQHHLYTIADLEALPDDPTLRRELIDGELIEYTAMGVQLIQLIRSRMAYYLESHDLSHVGMAATSLKCQLSADPDTLLIADVAFVRRDPEAKTFLLVTNDNVFSGTPNLVVLIKPPFIDEQLWFSKLNKWQWHNSSPAIWEVDVLEQTIDVFSRTSPQHGRTQTIQRDGVLETVVELPGLSIRLSDLFTSIGDPKVPGIANLPGAVFERIKKMRFDRIIEKHEGPFDWEDYLDTAEIMLINDHQVLLPIPWTDHRNIEILRATVSKNEQTITLFLKDQTFSNTADEFFMAGRLAVCDKVAGTDVFIAVVYHEWFVVNNEGML